MQRSRWLCPYDPHPIRQVAKLPPFSLSQTNHTALCNFTFRTRLENVLWRSSAFWLPRAFPKIYHTRVICVFHEHVKRSTIPQIESKQYALSNLRVIINNLCTLEDNGLKNDHPLSIPLSSIVPVNFYRQDYHRYLPDFPRRCVIALGWHKNTFLPPRLPLTIFHDSPMQVVSWILVHPILVDTI